MNSRQYAVGSRQCIRSGGSAHSLPTAYRLPPTHPSAFSLTEVLIVIGIIVLVLALAVPALNVISGSKSIEGAENNVSAMLGRARGDAIALQRDTGVLFFIDPATQNVTLAEVVATDRGVVPSTIETVLDLVPDRDFIVLPKGVYAQVIDNAVLSGGGSGTRTDDGYIGYNILRDGSTSDPSITRFGGVILFDAFGKLVSRSYAFRAELPAGGPTPLFNLLYKGAIAPDSSNTLVPPTADFVPANNQPVATSPMRSAYGLILHDREGFMNNWDLDDPQCNGAAYDAAELAEESWLDQNGTPLMVNRYNGTLVRGE